MPIPILFIGIAAVTGAAGIGKTIKAGVDQSKAKKLNTNSNDRIDEAAERLEVLRSQCGRSLEALGEEKMFVLNRSIMSFLSSFRQIKNVDFRDSVGLTELSKLHIDQTSFEEMEKMGSFAASLAEGSAAGAVGGALTAFGAYSAAATFASASTGTAISTLSGAAASNATLAFFGGGSLATGGLGMAGGMAVLGGLVAGPALLVMGVITGAMAGKNLENAKANAAQATEICEQLENGAVQCMAIRRRTQMFYNILARLDAHFYPLIYQMEDVIQREGYDYSTYTPESKRIVAATASMAVTIKSVLDTPLLTEDGSLTEDSKSIGSQMMKQLDEKAI
jgi:hypothetical protein